MTNEPKQPRQRGGRRSRNNATEVVEEKTKMTTDTAPQEEMTENGISVDLNSRVTFMVGIPAGLRIALDQFAKDNNTTTTDMARKALAGIVGYALPTSGKAVGRKYKDEDERKKAQAARNKQRRDLVNALLAQYKENEDEDEEEDGA